MPIQISARAGVLIAALSLLAPAGAVHAAPCWAPPVAATVTDPFRDPACRWCPGNRGIEYGTRTGARVTSVATGRVTFAGAVAGTTFVVVRHGDGRRVTYGNLRSESFDVGDVIVRGQMVGRAAGRFHLGLREGDRYVDPAPFIGRLVYRPRLIPVDGGRGNRPAAPRLTCRR